MLRALLFDKDGTLVDFHATWGVATLAVMRELAASDDARFTRLVDLAGYDLVAHALKPGSPLVAGSTADFAADWAAALDVEPGPAFQVRLDALFASAALDSVAAIEGAGSVLTRLGGRYRLGMLTNDSEAAAVQQCRKLGWASLFERVIGYDSGHGHKPDPGPVLAFARLAGVMPAEVAVIGDACHDLDAAKAAGAVAVAVLSGPADRAELQPRADHVIADVLALPALLERLAQTAR